MGRTSMYLLTIDALLLSAAGNLPCHSSFLASPEALKGRTFSDMNAAAQMYFENAYCINCWYKDLDQPFIKYPPFVIHYAGCQMCTGVF